MKQYPTYKQSGLIGVESIPAHWETLKLRLVCDQIFTGNTPVYSYEPNELLVFGQRNNQKNCIDFTGIKYADPDFFASRSEYEFLQYGDVLLNTLGGGSVGRIGFYDVKDKQVITDGHVMIFRGNKTCTQKYLYYFLYTQQPFLEEAAVGSTNQAFLTITQLYQWKIAVPSLAEQQAIAQFLDSKTAKIDESISLYEQQKADLVEYRKALISDTVTRGLNPNAKLKDGGIQWLGQIPEEWKVLKCGFLFKTIGSGTTPKSDNSTYYSEEGQPWLQTGDLNDGYITRTNKFVSELALSEYSLPIYPKGSIVIAMYGATIGKLGILDIETCTNQACCVLANGSDIENKFAFYALSAGKKELINSANGGGQPNISQAIIRDFRIPVPSLTEQQTIVSFLDSKTAMIDEAIHRIDEQIADLKAYRTALITDAVTGKIDVR